MQSNQERNEIVMSLRIQNSRSIALTFYLEPWGEQYTLAPEAAFEIVAKGPEGGSLEVEYADDHIILYGWSGSVINLFQDGHELGAGSHERNPVPPTPPVTASKRVIPTKQITSDRI